MVLHQMVGVSNQKVVQMDARENVQWGQVCSWWHCSKPYCECKSGCFPSLAKINLQNGKSILMSELQMGDQVQTGMIISMDTFSCVCSSQI